MKDIKITKKLKRLLSLGLVGFTLATPISAKAVKLYPDKDLDYDTDYGYLVNTGSHFEYCVDSLSAAVYCGMNNINEEELTDERYVFIGLTEEGRNNEIYDEEVMQYLYSGNKLDPEFGYAKVISSDESQDEIDYCIRVAETYHLDQRGIYFIRCQKAPKLMETANISTDTLVDLNQNTNENEIVVDNNNTGEVITARRPGFNTVIDKADDREIEVDDQIQDYTLPSDIEVIEVENTQYVVSTGLDTYYFESCTKEEVLESARVDHNLEITSEGELITNYFTHIIYFDGTADSYETISDEELYNICTTKNVIQVIRETSNRILFDAIEINNEVIESERPVIPAFEEPVVEEPIMEEPIMEEPIEEEYQETTSNNILDENFSTVKSLCNSNIMDITNFIYGNNLLETPQYIDFYDVLDNDIDRYAVGYFAALYNNIKSQAYDNDNREATIEAMTGLLNVYDQFTNGYSLSFDIDGDIIELTYNDITPKAKLLISSMVQPFTMINYNFQLESGKTTSDLLSEVLIEQGNAIGAINEEGYSNDTSEDEGMTYIIRP